MLISPGLRVLVFPCHANPEGHAFGFLVAWRVQPKLTSKINGSCNASSHYPLTLFFRRVSQTLPGDISRFENMATIEVDNNELSSLPLALASMSIYRLSLRRNSLSSTERVDEFLAPPSIAPPGSLPLSISVRELDLSSNGLGEVPGSIFACRGLQVGVLCAFSGVF